MFKLSDTKCKNKYGKIKKKKAATCTRQFRKTILKQDCASGITSFHSTLHLTRWITHIVVVSIWNQWNISTSTILSKRNACKHWTVSAMKREVTLENIGRPERRVDHQSIRQHIVWYKTPNDSIIKWCLNRSEQAKTLKNYRKCVALVFIQALSSVTNFAIGRTRPGRDTYLDRIIYQSIWCWNWQREPSSPDTGKV